VNKWRKYAVIARIHVHAAIRDLTQLRRSGRAVILSVGEHVRMPRTYRGRDIQWWMLAAGLLVYGWIRRSAFLRWLGLAILGILIYLWFRFE